MEKEIRNGKRGEKKSLLVDIAGSALALALVAASFAVILSAHAATNISPNVAKHWGWNDTIGWIDFYNTDTVNVNSKNLTGYASSSAGDISLDCHTTEIGDICASSTYQVTNDGSGNLSGYGWNDVYGWISFDCHNNNGCASSTYQAYVDASGNFQNYAWNDVAGWISFNCANTNGCGTSQYSVATNWVATSTTGTLDSSTFDTGAASGAQLNSFIWYGNEPSSTAVWFQFAVSNASSGPWSFMGPGGDGTTYYMGGSGTPQKLDYSLFNNYRYFRYRVVLVSNQTQTLSPQVDEIVVNWSP